MGWRCRVDTEGPFDAWSCCMRSMDRDRPSLPSTVHKAASTSKNSARGPWTWRMNSQNLRTSAAYSHDPISDRHSPWVLARRLGETAIHEALTNYLDPALNDEILEDILAKDDAELEKAKRMKEQRGTLAGFASAIVVFVTCGQAGCGMDAGGEEWEEENKPKDKLANVMSL